MKGREGKGPPSTDLLVCFPSRAHLTLMPKPICSPARTSSDSTALRRHHHHHHIKKSSIRSSSRRVVGQASPLSWSNKTKPISKDVINSEPTSPKVTCAGQIKVRSSKPASGSCKNWQSVMEEIERLHNNRKKSKKKKSTAWVESLGFKKDVMQFLTCLRNIRFDFRCFGSFPTSGITTDDDDDDDEDDEEEEEAEYQEPRISRGASDDGETSRTVFSKWFMVLQENNNNNSNNNKDLIVKKEKSDGAESNNEEAEGCAVVVPPPNALLLMRCRSAPAKSWLQDRPELLVEEESNDADDEEAEKEKEKQKEAMEEEEKRKKEEKLIVMRYGADFYKISTDIAKETWVVGGINNRDPLARSRSWKR